MIDSDRKQRLAMAFKLKAMVRSVHVSVMIILTFSVAILLYCSVYLDVLRFSSTTGLLINTLPTIRSLFLLHSTVPIPLAHTPHSSSLSPDSTPPDAFDIPTSPLPQPLRRSDDNLISSNSSIPPSDTFGVTRSSPHYDQDSPISSNSSSDSFNATGSAQNSEEISLISANSSYGTESNNADGGNSSDSDSRFDITRSMPDKVDARISNDSLSSPSVSFDITRVIANSSLPSTPVTAEDERCDPYNEGSWVRDESYPLYRSELCPFVDDGFRCQENGRPDQDYLKLRWQPSRCNIPRFNAEKMLERLRGKRLVFVGDSIGRNQWESMLCLLAEAVRKQTKEGQGQGGRIYEVNGEPITKHKGFLVFKIEPYDCYVEYYRSPFLVPQTRPPKNSPEGVKTVLKVDTMDWTSNRWIGAHAIVFNAGHWWTYEKTIRGGCYFQVGDHVNKSMDVKEGFTTAMKTWRKWVSSHINLTETKVFFRTFAPVHFSGGTWRTGGQCHTDTQPFPANMTFEGKPWTNEVVIREMNNLKGAHLMDITHLSNFRREAHSSIYHVGPSEPRPFKRQDCSHWCLPGLPDVWNELLYASLDIE